MEQLCRFRARHQVCKGGKSLPQLTAIGSVAAYLKAKRTGAKVSLNLLWALEGALTGLH